MKDLHELDLPTNIRLSTPDPNNLLKLHAEIVIDNPESLWYGARYNFSINVPASYPHEAPKCHCDTQIYHPNIDMQGNVCLNILRADWKPVLNLNAVALGLYFLFNDPNPNDPLNHEAAQLMRTSMQ